MSLFINSFYTIFLFNVSRIVCSDEDIYEGSVIFRVL